MASYTSNGTIVAVASSTTPTLLTRKINSGGIIIPIPQAFAGIAYFYPVSRGAAAPDSTAMLMGIQRTAGQELVLSMKGDVDLYHMTSASTMTATGFEYIGSSS